MRIRWMLCCAVAVGCNSPQHPTSASDSPVPPSAAAESQPNVEGRHFGAAFALSASEPLGGVIARIEKAAAPADAALAGQDGDAACAPSEGESHAGAAAETGAPTETGAAAEAGVAAEKGELTSCAGAVADESGETVRVSGTVVSVCQKAGCWMVLRDGEREARVFTRQHGFMLPKDSAGKTAEVEGTLRQRTLSADFAKHLHEDAGRDPGEVSGPRHEYLLTATAVTLR